MERLEGWERRLEDVLQAAESEPYVLGVHDCFKVACAAVHALTGVDFWPEWAGRYNTQQEALRLIVEYGGDFDGAFSRLFGTELGNPLFARRGDVLKFESEGVPHLGVCRGRGVVVLGEKGLQTIPLRSCAGVWKIG
jgi:hypothetical protein